MAELVDSFLAFAATELAVANIRLRVALPEDRTLLAAIYATTRADELAPLLWNEEQKKAFTDWQSGLQEEHYALHYPKAEFLIIERWGQTDSFRTPVGRIYLERTTSEVRLMEITLLPEFRNLGAGTRVMDALLRYADAVERRVTLHVEPFNPARRMYARMGFATEEVRGLYEFMARPVRPAS
ncbi:MAG: GNAT family N-acetyltransferase [Usitatibacteraceae bacterium]